METNKHGKGGSAFLWGFILGALTATLLTTKKGRQILRDMLDLGLELVEDFIEQKKQSSQKVQGPAKVDENTNHKAETTVDKADSIPEEKVSDEEIAEDLESEITEDEVVPEELIKEKEEELREVVMDVPNPVIHNMTFKNQSEPKEESETPKNGHSKKRLFRGLKKSK